MPTRRTVITTAGAIVAVGVLGLGIGAALDDPDERVASINLTGAQSQATPGSGGAGGSRQIAALEEVSGIVTRDDDGDRDDFDDLDVRRVDLDFGPDRWVASAGPIEDYDGDGTVEALRNELDGLVGTDARFRVRLDGDGDDGDVYTINDLSYRDVSGPAPWQSADAVGEDAIRDAAAAAVGEGARVVDLEAEVGSAVAWEAEVVDSQRREYDVLLDAAGNIIDVRQDD